MWGDIHGSAHSLCRTVLGFLEEDSWRIKDSYQHLVFLGDFVDRGAYSLETLYVLYRLKIRNPDQVWLLRGDHELWSMNRLNNFARELARKYSPRLGQELLRNIGQTYNYMPVSLWVAFEKEQHPGSDADAVPSASSHSATSATPTSSSAPSSLPARTEVIDLRASPTELLSSRSPERLEAESIAVGSAQRLVQFCHGGMEMGWMPTQFLLQPDSVQYQQITHLNRRLHGDVFRYRRSMDRRHGLLESDPAYNGFMWSDFLLDSSDERMRFNPGRGLVYSKYATEYLLERYETAGRNHVQMIFRGHQHSIDQGILFDLIKDMGVVALWSGDAQRAHERRRAERDLAHSMNALALSSAPPRRFHHGTAPRELCDDLYDDDLSLSCSTPSAAAESSALVRDDRVSLTVSASHVVCSRSVAVSHERTASSAASASAITAAGSAVDGQSVAEAGAISRPTGEQPADEETLDDAGGETPGKLLRVPLSVRRSVKHGAEDTQGGGDLVYTLLSAPSSCLLFGVDNYCDLVVADPDPTHWSLTQVCRQIPHTRRSVAPSLPRSSPLTRTW